MYLGFSKSPAFHSADSPCHPGLHPFHDSLLPLWLEVMMRTSLVLCERREG